MAAWIFVAFAVSVAGFSFAYLVLDPVVIEMTTVANSTITNSTSLQGLSHVETMWQWGPVAALIAFSIWGIALAVVEASRSGRY